MMRAMIGTQRRRAITVSSTDEYVELHVDSVLELLRFTGIAIAAARMGMEGSPGDEEQDRNAIDGGTVALKDQDEGSDGEEEGSGRDIYLSYRSVRIKVS